MFKASCGKAGDFAFAKKEKPRKDLKVITKLRCPFLQQLAVSGGSQILTSGEQTFASLKRKLEGKCLWHFLEQWRYKGFLREELTLKGNKYHENIK